MKVGDLVACNHPSRSRREQRRLGMIIARTPHHNGLGCTNKMFKVLWHNGRVDNRLWDYDLELINENR